MKIKVDVCAQAFENVVWLKNKTTKICEKQKKETIRIVFCYFPHSHAPYWMAYTESEVMLFTIQSST